MPAIMHTCPCPDEYAFRLGTPWLLGLVAAASLFAWLPPLKHCINLSRSSNLQNTCSQHLHQHLPGYIPRMASPPNSFTNLCWHSSVWPFSVPFRNYFLSLSHGCPVREDLLKMIFTCRFIIYPCLAPGLTETISVDLKRRFRMLGPEWVRNGSGMWPSWIKIKWHVKKPFPFQISLPSNIS